MELSTFVMAQIGRVPQGCLVPGGDWVSQRWVIRVMVQGTEDWWTELSGGRAPWAAAPVFPGALLSASQPLCCEQLSLRPQTETVSWKRAPFSYVPEVSPPSSTKVPSTAFKSKFPESDP